MHPLEKQFEKIKKENRLGLMTHVVVGYPNLETTRELVKTMSESGADYIELQIPFSDPVGDGPTIREANTAALENGVCVHDAFILADRLTHEDAIATSLLFMTYFNIVLTYGIEKFCHDAGKAGIVGLIIPDYPLEAESHEHLESEAEKNNLVLIRFASLDSTEERLKKLGEKAEGFVYCFSTRGTTGVRSDIDGGIQPALALVKKYFQVPAAVGFGISNAEQIRTLKGSADMVVVGSALVKACESGGKEGVRKKMEELVIALK